MKVRYHKRKEDGQWIAEVRKRNGKVEIGGPYPEKRMAEMWVEYSQYDDDTGKPVHNYRVD